MGIEANLVKQALSNPAHPPTNPLQRWAQESAERQAQAEAEERRKIEDARADAKAVWALADYYMPADVKQMAERWGMQETLIEMWRGAFIEGWRAAHRGKP